MAKIKVDAIVKDSKLQIGKAAGMSVNDKFINAERLEGVTPDTKSEVIKLLDRAEERAKEELKTYYYSMVVKHTLAELRAFKSRYDDDKALRRDAASVAKRLLQGAAATDHYSRIPVQTVDAAGNKVLEWKVVKDLHDAFLSCRRSLTAVNWDRVLQAEKERKAAEERRVHISELSERVQRGETLTAAECLELATLAVQAVAKK